MPGEPDAMRRLPGKPDPPLETAPVTMLLVDSATGFLLEDDASDALAADRKAAIGPPRPELGGESMEGRGRVPGYRDGAFNRRQAHGCTFFLFVGSGGAGSAAANACSTSSQSDSMYCRNPASPRGSAR